MMGRAGVTYCSRCDRNFSSPRASQQHVDASARHYRCDVCGYDALTWDQCVEHHWKTKHRTVCQGCNDGKGMTWPANSDEYFDHLKDQNVCDVCNEHFMTFSNLNHHSMVHLERSIECYGCFRKFVTYPAMILHLEPGTCPSNINIIDLNESAAMCYQWKAYIDADFRDELLNRRDLKLEYSGSVFPYKCPECDSAFSKLSGLFQHVYSQACDQRLDEGNVAKLIRWLGNRHNLGG